MQISCPYCDHKSTVKELKPGRYKPKCPKCNERFSLELANDPGATLRVARLPATQPQTVENTGAAETLPANDAKFAATIPASTPTAHAKKPAAQSQAAANSQATGATTTSIPSQSASSVQASSVQASSVQASSVQASSVRASSVSIPAQNAASSNSEATTDFYATNFGGSAANRDTKPNRALDETAPISSSRSTRSDSESFTVDDAQSDDAVPDTLGGYRILKELGRGAMGAVYLAKQVSLNRNVALKVIQSKWAKEPTFIARFIREAYAAAQLTHHNVIQIYDLGNDGDTNFFSMEYVNGCSLSQLVEKHGKLDPEQAVGYILQAARGLAFAHNQGMVHRDVKPANMMVNDAGIVKVADLGLVKTPQLVDEPDLQTADGQSSSAARSAASAGVKQGSTSLSAATASVTMVDMAMGTPAYMAPEQAENAAGVDHRADIYSLGCSLYVLLTGKPPFQGSTIMDVITKHRTQPAVRPDVVVKRIPPSLSELVLKMMAKRPEDRYQNLDEVIRECEKILGVATVSAFTPSEAQAQTLEDAESKFNASVTARLRKLALPAIWAICLALAVLCLFINWSVAVMFGLMGLSSAVGYFVLSGFLNRTYLFGKCREYLANLRISDWLTSAAAVLLCFVILFLTNWIWLGLVGIVVGIGLACLFSFVIDAQVTAERKEAVDTLQAMIKSMRLKGVDEQAIQTFIGKYSSDHWEELFETLFGYEAKLAARQTLSRNAQGKPRPKFRAWRERVIAIIDNKLKEDRETRDKEMLQRVEEADLKAQGMDEMQARRRAAQVADALIDAAAQQRQLQSLASAAAQSSSAPTIDPKIIAAQRRSKQLAMLADARSGKYMSKRKVSAGRLITGPIGFLLSGKLRFLAGVVLLTLLAISLRDAGAVDAVKNVAQSGGDLEQITAQGVSTVSTMFRGIVSIPLVGDVNRILVAAAGMLLVVCGMYRGWQMSLIAWPLAAAILMASKFIT